MNGIAVLRAATATLCLGTILAISGCNKPQKYACSFDRELLFMSAASELNQAKQITFDQRTNGRTIRSAAKYVPYHTPRQLLNSVPQCCEIDRRTGGRSAWTAVGGWLNRDVRTVRITFLAKYIDASGEAGSSQITRSIDVDLCGNIVPFPR